MQILLCEDGRAVMTMTDKDRKALVRECKVAIYGSDGLDVSEVSEIHTQHPCITNLIRRLSKQGDEQDGKKE